MHSLPYYDVVGKEVRAEERGREVGAEGRCRDCGRRVAGGWLSGRQAADRRRTGEGRRRAETEVEEREKEWRGLTCETHIVVGPT